MSRSSVAVIALAALYQATLIQLAKYTRQGWRRRVQLGTQSGYSLSRLEADRNQDPGS